MSARYLKEKKTENRFQRYIMVVQICEYLITNVCTIRKLMNNEKKNLQNLRYCYEFTSIPFITFFR